MVGVEIEVRGRGAADLLEREVGLHCWRARSGGEDRLLRVLVARCDHDTYAAKKRPADLHRKKFFTEDRPRRTLDGAQVTDRNYRKEAHDEDFLRPGGTLQRWLEERFLAQIIEDLTS